MKHLSVIVVSLLITLTSSAQSWSALPWMRTSRGAADISMAGSAFMSESNMAWASSGNAAMIPFCKEKMSVEAGYMLLNPAKTNYVNAAFAYNIKGKIGVTAGLSYGFDPAFDIYNESGKVTGQFTPGKLMFSAGASWRFIDVLSAGLNVRYAMQTLAEGQSSSAVAADVVLMGQFGDFSVSAGAVNVGTPVKGIGGTTFPLASSAKVAAMYDKAFASVHGLQVNIDADYYFSNSFTAAAGAQYGWNDMVFVRAGYRYSTGTCVIPSFASVGIGCKFKGIRLDLAYLPAGEGLRNTISAGIGYSF